MPLGTQLRSQPLHASIYSNTTEWINKRHRIFTTCEFMLTYCSIISKEKKENFHRLRLVCFSITFTPYHPKYSIDILLLQLFAHAASGRAFLVLNFVLQIGMHILAFITARFKSIDMSCYSGWYRLSALYRSHICDRITRST